MSLDEPRKEETGLVRTMRNKLVQSGIAGIPFVGGPIQAYIANTLTELDKRQWEEYWESVERRLDGVEEEKINTDYFASEDFVRRVREIYHEVIASRDDQKLAFLRDYFVACTSKLESDVTWRDLSLQYLKGLTGAHLATLRHYFELQGSLSQRDRFELPARTDMVPLGVDSVGRAFASWDAQVIAVLISDLSSHGLLAPWLGEPKEPKGWSITDAGIRFMAFLTELWT
jgi:hypothetical protein